jgi:Holliday junction resolvase
MRRRAPLERTIVAKVMASARALGWWVMKTHGGSFGTVVGLPDVMAIKNGRVVWMEVKRPGEEPTRVQLHRQRELAGFGCKVTTVFSAGDAKEFLEACDE